MRKCLVLTSVLVVGALPLLLRGASVAAPRASCPLMTQGPPCQEFWRADAVFIGEAVEVKAVDWSGTNLMPTSAYMRLTARLSVEEAFRGVEASEVVFEMNDCPYPFKQGERYLVYAHRDRDGKLYQRIGASRTRPLAEASEDLEYLRGMLAEGPGARIYGKVTRHTHNIRESRYDYEPLEGLKVTLEGEGKRREATTDAEGFYQFVGVAAGTYRVSAALPAHLSADAQSFPVKGSGCVPVDIAARRDGWVGARVLDAGGRPVKYVPVSLVAADASPEDLLAEGGDKHLWTFGLTDEQGRLSFSHLAPGRYLLVINRAEFERSRGSEQARSLPRLFYPGVGAVGQATAVRVREGQTSKEYDFRLPPP